MSEQKNIPYQILMHKFLGGNDKDGYKYELTFNQSMVHTGRHKGICDGLDAYREKEISDYEDEILREAEEIKAKYAKQLE